MQREGHHRTAWFQVAAMALLLGLALCACGGEQASAQAAPTDPSAGDTPAPTEQPAKAATAVAKIVFVDQEVCCNCTRERIDGTWAELQKALEAGPEVPVERIHGDTQEEQARPYLDMRPLMVAPGLYFLDADGGLVEMFQGELTEAQIAAVLS